MSEIKEPLWGELDEAPASMERRPPLFLFRNHFDHCSKDQDGGLKHGISSKKGNSFLSFAFLYVVLGSIMIEPRV